MKVYDSNRDFNKGQLKNFRVEIVSALPLASTSVPGREVILSSGGHHTKHVVLDGEWRSTPSTMSDIKGLNISGMHSKDLLVANNGEFENQSYLVVNSYFSMSRLSDVRISGAQAGDVMRLSGSYWRNKKIISDAIISTKTGWSSTKTSTNIAAKDTALKNYISTNYLNSGEIVSNYFNKTQISTNYLNSGEVYTRTYTSTNFVRSNEVAYFTLSDALISSKMGWSSKKIRNFISTDYLNSSEILAKVVSDAIVSSKFGWSSKKIKNYVSTDFVMSNELPKFTLSDAIISSKMGWSSTKVNAVLSDYLNSSNVAANVSTVSGTLTSQYLADKINAILSSLINAGLMHS